jgi:hypothetical protein
MVAKAGGRQKADRRKSVGAVKDGVHQKRVVVVTDGGKKKEGWSPLGIWMSRISYF